MAETDPPLLIDNAFPAAIQTALAGERALLRLSSRLPADSDGINPPVIAGRQMPMNVGATHAWVVRVLCVAPGEWWIVADEYTASSFRDQVAVDLLSQDLTLVDLSEEVVVFELVGPAVRKLLSKGCGVDLDPGSFPPGRCMRTRFAGVPIVLDCIDELSRFDLYVGRGDRRHLHERLIDAAVQFGALGR